MEATTFDWVEESNDELVMPSVERKRKRPKRREFLGWGSRELIGFLESIGKSSGEELSQFDVTSIINQYINEKGLMNPAKKRRILCDEWLQVLFGKKSIARCKIHDLLEPHYAENADSDDQSYSSDEREDKKRGRASLKELPIDEKSRQPPNAPAAIIMDNIKAVYLKKTLVERLLKDPETVQKKVIGSFVRVKADRYDCRQKNPYVLQLVTGIVKDAADGDKVCLEIAEMGTRVHVSELSEANCSEEECQDLHRRILEDDLKQPTVAELQEKVQLLHEDITKDWLPRELRRLGHCIDRANEKGWRRELFELREKKKLLETPAEVSRLLEKVPQVIAEKPKVDPALEDTEVSLKKITSKSPTVSDWVISNGQPAKGASKTSGKADLKAQEVKEETIIQHEALIQVKAETAIDKPINIVVTNEVKEETIIQHKAPIQVKAETAIDKPINIVVTNGNISLLDPKEMNTGVRSSPKEAKKVDLDHAVDLNKMNASAAGSVGKQAEVIELSDDEGDIPPPSSLEERAWHYKDPKDVVQGPFNLESLKRWSDLNFFPPGFTVWKVGQNQEQSVLLSELLHQMFPH